MNSGPKKKNFKVFFLSFTLRLWLLVSLLIFDLFDSTLPPVSYIIKTDGRSFDFSSRDEKTLYSSSFSREYPSVFFALHDYGKEGAYRRIELLSGKIGA